MYQLESKLYFFKNNVIIVLYANATLNTTLKNCLLYFMMYAKYICTLGCTYFFITDASNTEQNKNSFDTWNYCTG